MSESNLDFSGAGAIYSVQRQTSGDYTKRFLVRGELVREVARRYPTDSWGIFEMVDGSRVGRVLSSTTDCNEFINASGGRYFWIPRSELLKLDGYEDVTGPTSPVICKIRQLDARWKEYQKCKTV